MRTRVLGPRLVLLLLLIGLTSCGLFRLADYDQRAYENATYLKAKTVALLNSIGLGCEIDESAISEWRLAMEAAYEYANGIAHNNEAALNWRTLIDDIAVSPITACRDLLADDDSPSTNLSKAFFTEALHQTRQGFDVLICLEANKRRASSCATLVNAE